MGNQKKAYVFACVTVLFWSTSASAFKICLLPERLDTGVLPLLFYASAVSTIAFFAHLLASRKLRLLRGLSRKEVLHSAGLGLLNPFLYYVVLLKAYSVLPAQQAQPLNFLWPITLVLLSIPMLGQKVKPRDIVAIVISFLGVFIISTKGDILRFKFSSPLGVSLAVGSTVVWALFWILNTKDKVDESVRLFLNFAFGSAYVLLLMLLLGKGKILSIYGLLGTAYVGLFEMGITFLLWLKTLRLSTRTAHIANLIYLVPFLSLIVVRVVIGEAILPATVIGLIFIVGGIVLQRLGAEPLPRFDSSHGPDERR